MSMHVALSSPRSSRSLATSSAAGPYGLVHAASGIDPVMRATEGAAARNAADPAIARSIELSLGRRQESLLYDRRGRLDAPAVPAPAAEEEAGADERDAAVDAAARARPDPAEAPDEAVAGSADEGIDAEGDAAEADPPVAAFVASGGTVKVEILASDSGYDNQIVVSFDGFKTYTTIGIDNQPDGEPASFDVPAGTSLDFGIVNGEGTLLRAGAAVHNPDGLEHARSEVQPDGALTIGFEDLTGGGDLDFDDAVIRVTQVRQTDQAPGAAGAGDAMLAAHAADDAATQADAAIDAEAEDMAAHVAEEAEVLASSELQNSQLAAMAERNRQLLAALYLPEPALPADPLEAADDVRPSDVDQPWR